MDPSQKTFEVFLVSRHFLRSHAVGQHEGQEEHLTVSQGCENLPVVKQKGCRFRLEALGGKGYDRAARKRGI